MKKSHIWDVTEIKYNKKGNLVHFKDIKNGSPVEIRYRYDENNNLIYRDNNGFKLWFKYDKNNNLIYKKNSNNDKFLYEYDENNNCIHSTNIEANCESIYEEMRNKKYEVWSKYDKNNNLIYTINSYGTEKWYKNRDI